MSAITCACGNNPAFIVACSGAADVGELADLTARRLSRDKKGAMFCLAGVGARINGFVKSAEGAENILVLDGCPLNCAAKTLKEVSIEKFMHITVTELGLVKGQCGVSEANIVMIYNKASDLLKESAKLEQ